MSFCSQCGKLLNVPDKHEGKSNLICLSCIIKQQRKVIWKCHGEDKNKFNEISTKKV